MIEMWGSWRWVELEESGVTLGVIHPGMRHGDLLRTPGDDRLWQYDGYRRSVWRIALA